MRYLFALLAMVAAIEALDIEGCNKPLGMETGEISDQDLSASSSFDANSVGPQNARVRTERAGGAWCPANQVKPGTQEWLQIDLRSLTVLTAVETQGRYGGGQGLEYPLGYMLEYWRPGMDQWKRYRNRTSNELIEGNNNTFTSALRELDAPIVATKVRFVPWSDYTRTICMRVEVYGCSYADRLVSYSMPQGVKGEFDLRDKTYDGQFDANSLELVDGLGQLFDGKVGEDDFSLSPYEWIGWRKNDFSATVEVVFEFKDIRNFTSMSFHCNNQFDKGVQVFSKVRFYFGLEKTQFPNAFMEYSYTTDVAFDTSRWVKVSIPFRVGRYVKAELEFASKYLLVSEVQFESTVKGNISSQLTMQGFNDNSTYKQVVVPFAFDDSDKRGSKYKAEKMAVFNLTEMPAEYVGLIVGISLAVAGICAVIVLILLLRQRKSRSTSPVCSTSTAYGFGAYTANLRAVQMYLNDDGTSAAVVKTHRTSASDCNSFVVNFPRIEDELLDKLPRSPPPNRHHPPTSPPPAYQSNCQTEESSEYADPDSPMKSSSEIPLLPPPPAVNRRRGSLKLNFTNFAQKSKDYLSDDSLHYASSLVNSPESIEANMIGSFGRCYSFTSAEEATETVPQIPRHLLRIQEKLGEGEFGEVHLCLMQATQQPSTSNCCNGQLVAVKSLRKSANENAKQDFQREVHVLSKLKDENIVQLLGVCTQDEPWIMVVEYMNKGDLNQYLQLNAEKLKSSSLIYIASQVSSGMKYLESMNLVHRDLATRNCLVGENLQIKIADFGMARSLYSSDYYRIEGRFILPIRWMAWECILLGKFTTKTDVWAFGVTLWEILTYAKCQPFAELNDAQVIDNIQNIYHNGFLQVYLPQSANVPSEMYDLMRECWNRDESLRPSFKEIHLFLQRKLLGSTSTTNQAC